MKQKNKHDPSGKYNLEFAKKNYTINSKIMFTIDIYGKDNK